MSFRTVTVFVETLHCGVPAFAARTYSTHALATSKEEAARKAAARFFEVTESDVELLENNDLGLCGVFIAANLRDGRDGRDRNAKAGIGFVAILLLTIIAAGALMQIFAAGGAR